MTDKAQQTEQNDFYADKYLLRAIGIANVDNPKSVSERAKIIGMSRANWYRRLIEPSKFTLGELRKMAKAYSWDEKTIYRFIFG